VGVSDAPSVIRIDSLSTRRAWVDGYRGGLLLTADMRHTPRFDPRALADHIGEPIDVTGPDGVTRRMVIRRVEPADDDGAMLTLEEPAQPVPTTPYPDPIPREDQDTADACCAPVRGAEVPTDQVRPAADTRDTTGDRDG
jgi:hypothetical protein